MRYWSAKCAPISCIATSHVWVAARSQTPRPWVGGSGAASARADTRQNRDYSAREKSGSWAQNARGYDGSGDQHSLSDRFEPAGGWGQGADPHHEKDHQNCGRGRNRVTRSESKRTAQVAGDCARGARQGRAEPREAKVGLQQIITCDQSSGRPGEAVRRGDRRWREAVEVPLEADGTGGSTRGARDHGSARQAGDEADPGTHLSR